jgi:hypothetical protein
MRSIEVQPAYSIGKGKRTFKFCDRDEAVPGPAAYTIDREFHKEAISSSLTKDLRLRDQVRLDTPGPGAYDIPVTIGTATERYELAGDLASANRRSASKSPIRKKLKAAVLGKAVESHPSLLNSPKTK